MLRITRIDTLNHPADTMTYLLDFSHNTQMKYFQIMEVCKHWVNISDTVNLSKTTFIIPSTSTN